MAKRITIGTTVNWRGAWGNEPAEKAVITDIQLCKRGDKYGRTVNSIAPTTKDRCVFDLDNGHWAYGHQIDLLT